MEFARGSIRKGALTDQGSGDKCRKGLSDGLWAQREVHAGLYILIANELCPDYGLFNL